MPDAPSTAKAPLLEAVLERGRQPDTPFHVPGHKRGKGVQGAFQQVMGSALQFDTTEVAGMDFLGSPTGVIKDAQEAAALAFGADHTWFLINGCTVGIQAAVMAVARPGDTLLLARNCHQSAFAAMALTGCNPYWLYPETDPEFQVAHGITPSTLRAGLQDAEAQGRYIAGVLIVSPTYYGAASHVAELARVCHEAGTVLLVDEAHGAHFGLHPALPPSALQQGADLAIQSTHKMLSAMTQAAMLHVSGERVSHARVSRALQTLQSTSPSYLLLASLDAARLLARDADACFALPLQVAEAARAGMSGIPGLRVLGQDLACIGGEHLQSRYSRNGMQESSNSNSSSSNDGSSGIQLRDGSSCKAGSSMGSSEAYRSLESSRGTYCSTSSSSSSIVGAARISAMINSESRRQFESVAAYDPLRLTVSVSGWGRTGFEVAEALECRFHIVPELATQMVVLFMLGPGSTLNDARMLLHAFRELASEVDTLHVPAFNSRNEARISRAVSSSHLEDAETSTPNGSARALGSHRSSLDTDIVTGSAGNSGSGSSSSSCNKEPSRGQGQPEICLSPRDALFASTHRVHHSQAVGCVCAELLCPYPPGVPLLFPGEVITHLALQALLLAAMSGTVTGASDPTLEHITVLTV